MQHHIASPQKILIVKTSSLGDVIHAFPAVQKIREMLPDAEIDWMVKPQFIPLVSLHPAVNKVIPYQSKGLSNPFLFFPTFCVIARNLRQKEYDIVIDFQGLLRTGVFVGLSRAKRKVGFSNPREALARLFYNEKHFVENKKIHAVMRNLRLAAETLSCDETLVWPPLKKDQELQANIEKFLPKDPMIKTVGIVPGARWESKVWPISFFASVMDQLAQKDSKIRFVIIGAPEDQAIGEALQINYPNLNIVNAAGKTNSAELIELIRACDAVLSSDTGPLHIAVALNIHTFSLFGPNDPSYSGPLGENHHIYSAKISCAPCMKRRCPIMKGNIIPCHDTLPLSQIVNDIYKTLHP